VTALPAPVFTCPPVVVAECAGGLTPVSFTATAVDFNGSPVPVTCIPPSGTGFRLGQSNVICTATDSFGSSGSCNFAVAVADTTPPQVSCPGDISLHTTNATGIAVDYIASAADSALKARPTKLSRHHTTLARKERPLRATRRESCSLGNWSTLLNSIVAP